MVKAMYAFSGDPITYGHIDIIKRVSKSFDEVIVGIGANPDKKYMFDLEERTKMANKSLVNIPNVKVISFQGLLVDYAYENDIPVVVKAVRNSSDVEYESILQEVGKSQKLGIDTHILFARPELAHISSSVVKAIQKEHGLIHEYVPLYVKQCLEAKMSEQYIVGVTGEMGVGKSYISKRFKEIGNEKEISVNNIELDHIPHQIYNELKEPQYVKLRRELIEIFGESVKLKDGTINRKALGEIVFNDFEKLNKLNEMIYTPLMVRLRKELYGKKGLILINAALIAESNMSYLSNNNVILVTADKSIQEKRLKGKGLNEEQIKRRLASQYASKEKKKNLEQKINEDKQGNLWEIDNSSDSDSSEIINVFENLVKELNVK